MCLCLHGDSRSHWAEVIKSHGQTWNRPTRLRYCNLMSIRELNNWLLAEGKLMMAFQQIWPGSWFRSGNELILKIELESKRQTEREREAQSESYYTLSHKNIWSVFFHCCIFPYFLSFLSHSASFSDVALSLGTGNPLERFSPAFSHAEFQSLTLTLFYLRHLLGIRFSSCWSHT